MLTSLPPAIFIAPIVAFLASILIVLTKSWHGRFSMDGLLGIQKMHAIPTPRVGGVAIFVGVVSGWMVSAPLIAEILGFLIIASLPAFIFGVAEDITKKVSVSIRLFATMVSSVLGWWMTGYSLTSVDVPFIDYALVWMPLSVLFTAIGVGGMANAVNIIDGFNGLASGFVLMAMICLGLVAGLHGDNSLSMVCFTFAASMFGFWLVNWPFGKIFLGDGGSYFSGFALAWISVLLIERIADVSAFAALLICIHPVTEVLFSIFRRSLKSLNPGHPDRLHLHSLIMRRFISRLVLVLNGGDRNSMMAIRNPVTGMFLALMSLPYMLMAILLANDPALAALCCLLFVISYVTVYARLVRFRWYSPLVFLFLKPCTFVARVN